MKCGGQGWSGSSCLFCFGAVSEGLLCFSGGPARQMLQMQIRRQGWDSWHQPGVPALGLNFVPSLLLAVGFHTD